MRIGDFAGIGASNHRASQSGLHVAEALKDANHAAGPAILIAHETSQKHVLNPCTASLAASFRRMTDHLAGNEDALSATVVILWDAVGGAPAESIGTAFKRRQQSVTTRREKAGAGNAAAHQDVETKHQAELALMRRAIVPSGRPAHISNHPTDQMASYVGSRESAYPREPFQRHAA